MKDTFIIGMVLGVITGAMIASYKGEIGNAVEKGKRAVKKQIEKM